MLEGNSMKEHYLKDIFEHIQDGMIMMDQDRKILLMNPSARKMTGWEHEGYVPYCSYCRQRELVDGEERCYLISRLEVPYFLSEMPTYRGQQLDVEMSTAVITGDSEAGHEEILLVLRDQTVKKKTEESRLSKVMIRQLIDAQENEHRRLAQELHDGVGQSLYSISLALQASEAHRKADKRLDAYIQEVRRELDRVLTDVKAYSHRLRPHTLDQLGLVPTLGGHVKSMEEACLGTVFSFETNISGKLDAAVEINVYRIMQEALHNIVKYAQAKDVSIRLFRQNKTVQLAIEDNGVGFQQEKVKEGLGLRHMEERILQLNGQFDIVSIPGDGTRITAIIPCNAGDCSD